MQTKRVLDFTLQILSDMRGASIVKKVHKERMDLMTEKKKWQEAYENKSTMFFL